MPQLNFQDFAPQLIWLVITFVGLYFALSRIALPRVERVITERKARIEGDLQNARDARAKADDEIARYEAALASARATGQARVRAARAKLEAEFAATKQSAENTTMARVEDAQKSVQFAVSRASSQMTDMTSGLVADIVKQFTGFDVAEAEVETALRQTAKG